MDDAPTIHAGAVLTGATAVLIRGPAGSGKSSLALALLQAAAEGLLPFARLVADDRCHLDVHGGRLLVSPAAKLGGLIEVRGLGIRQVPHEPVAVVGLVVDLDAGNARMPGAAEQSCVICGVTLPRLAVGAKAEAAALVLAALRTRPGSI